MEKAGDLLEQLSSSYSWVSVLTALIVLLASWHVWLHLSLPGEVPMIWSWIPYLGSAIEMGANPLAFVDKCAAKQKGKAEEGIFGAVIAGTRYIFLVDPADYDILFKQRKDLSFQHLVDRVSVDVFGVPRMYIHHGNSKEFHSLFSTHLLNDNQCLQLVESMQLAMVQCLGPMLQSDSGREITLPAGGDLVEFVREVVLTATFASLWGMDSDAATPRFRDLFMDFDAEAHRLISGLPEWQYPKASKAKKEMLKMLCNASPQPSNSALIRRRGEVLLEKGVPPEAIAGFQLGITWASVAQTVPATFWLLYHILRTEGLKEIIMQEIVEVIAQDPKTSGDSVTTPTAGVGETKTGTKGEGVGLGLGVDATALRPHHLAGMPKLQSCFSEVMRMSAASMGLRIATERTTITRRNGTTYTVRKGDAVTGMFIAAHHRPSIYPDPYAFKWDRYLPQADGTPAAFYSDGKKLPQPMLGFGGGYTYCPGRKFAMSEAKFYAAYILLNCDVSFVMDDTPDVPPLDFDRTGVGILYPKKPYPNVRVVLKQSNNTSGSSSGVETVQ